MKKVKSDSLGITTSDWQAAIRTVQAQQPPGDPGDTVAEAAAKAGLGRKQMSEAVHRMVAAGTVVEGRAYRRRGVGWYPVAVYRPVAAGGTP